MNIEILIDTDPEEIDIEIEALMRNVKESSEKLLALKGELSGDVGDLLSHIESPGKLADLVILKADPTKDIDNAKQIETVIKDGRIVDRSRLQLPVNAKTTN